MLSVCTKLMYVNHQAQGLYLLLTRLSSWPLCPGGDLGGEYARQRNYLEKTIVSLKHKLAADSEAHRADELKIMSQNVTLIRELNELRREIKVRWTVGCVHAGAGSF